MQDLEFGVGFAGKTDRVGALAARPQPGPVCNICGCEEFMFPAIRRAFGAPPMCASCKSVERHRIVRELYKHVGRQAKCWRAFQFAPDRSVEPGWFAHFESSVFDNDGGVDMQATGFPDAAFDLVISNHVLEHVADDVKALRETLRIVGKSGIVHVCVPSPIYAWETQDWGFADPTKNYHYRNYGADFPMRMRREVPGALCCSVVGVDPVTGVSDVIFFFSQAADSLRNLAAHFQHRAVPVFRYW